MGLSENFQVSRYGAGALETQLHELTIVLLLALGLLMFASHVRYMIPVLLVGSVLVPLGQVVMIGSIHLQVSRILLVLGWVRLISSGVLQGQRGYDFKMNAMDRVFVLWALSNSIAFIALYQDSGAFINRMGFLLNTIGTYFLMRTLFQSQQDIDRAICVLGLLCAVVATFMVIEQFSGRNIFSLFGGVPEMDRVRDGKIRSQGPFAHALLAGTFGAMLLPLFVGLRQRGQYKGIAIVAIIAATIMVGTSASSTPVLVYSAGIIGLFCWPFRKWMKQFRWGLLGLLIGLHLIMEAPVWALISRIDVTGSSSSYHRYKLVDLTIEHISNWWLLGMPDTSIWGWDMGDTANQFVDVAVTGGLVTLVLFIALIVCAFSKIGVMRKSWEHHPASERQAWALGICLFSNVVAFFGITYFDQTMIVWLTILALISSAKIAGVKARPNSVGV